MKKYDFALVAMYVIVFALSFTYSYRSAREVAKYNGIASEVMQHQDIDSLIIRNSNANIDLLLLPDSSLPATARWQCRIALDRNEVGRVDIVNNNLVIDSLMQTQRRGDIVVALKLRADIPVRIENSPNVEWPSAEEIEKNKHNYDF